MYRHYLSVCLGTGVSGVVERVPVTGQVCLGQGDVYLGTGVSGPDEGVPPVGGPAWGQGPRHTHLLAPHLEAAVVLGDRVSEVHAFPLAQELTQLRPLL